MTSLFDANFFSKNREVLRRKMGSNTPVIITANGHMQRAADEPQAFTQDSSFWYLTGLDDPDAVLVMGAAETFLVLPTLTPVRIAFDGDYDRTGIAARSGISTILTEREGWERIRQLISTDHQVATLLSPPSYIRHYNLYTLPFRRRLIAKLRRTNKAVQLQDIRAHLATLRCRKQPSEIEALRRAIHITCDTLADITTSPDLQQAEYEYELEAAISYGFRKRGATRHAFSPIVGAGQHSTTLHHLSNQGLITSQDFIVLDVGAEVEHYAADITRTVCPSKLTPRQQAIFDAVIDTQDYALAQLKPGTDYMTYEHNVAKYLGKHLVHLGVIPVATDAAIRQYYPQSTSHFLGLDTHDVGDYHAPLEQGMVLTCEPGIYIPEEGLGVRIEDDVLITEYGHEVLSQTCPRALNFVQ